MLTPLAQRGKGYVILGRPRRSMLQGRSSHCAFRLQVTDHIILDQRSKVCDGSRGPLGDRAHSTHATGPAYPQPIRAHMTYANSSS